MWRFRIKRTTKIIDFMKLLSKRGGVPTDRLRLWGITSRKNRTIRVDDVLTEEQLSKEVVSLLGSDPAAKSLKLFLEELSPTAGTRGRV